MISGVSPEALLLAIYAVFLVLAALVLEWLARASHHRAQRYQVAGFRYDAGQDIWECPAEQMLVRVEVDYDRHLVRYRAPAHKCNACSIKPICTDSDTGREVEQPIEGSFAKELRRFHRGISLALVSLACFLLAVEIARHHQSSELVLLCALIGPIGAFGIRLASLLTES